MPSTYTGAGIELIGDGEQSGTWGSTTNANLQILDRITSQAGAISLSGTTHTLTISDGTLSDGQYAVLVFGGSPSGTNTVTISPNDAKRVFLVKNGSGQSVVLTQGSGGNVTVADGRTATVYCDGAGTGAEVVDLSSTFLSSADATKLAGIESGATADQTAGEIKTAYESNSDTNAFTDALLSKLNGIEASADVTDTTNVTAAGALMDSELTDLAGVKALDTSTLATLTGTQTLTNKTLTSPAINVTSDATGDIYYRTAGGAFARLGIGSTDQVLTVASGLPSWADAGGGGGLTLLETVEPVSDVAAITYATTTFTSYEQGRATLIAQGASTPTSYDLEVEQGGAWRRLIRFTETFSSNVAVIVVDVFNVSNADGTGVVFAVSVGVLSNTGFDRSNASDAITESSLGPHAGYTSYGGAITGVRWVASNGNFEGSSANNRAIAKLYAG